MCRALANQLREQNHADADDLASARAVVRSRVVCCEDRERKGEIVSDLIERLRRHLRTLSPHIRERLTGQLLIEAADEIVRLKHETTQFRLAWGMEESDRVVTGFPNGSLVVDSRGGDRRRCSRINEEIVRLEAENRELLARLRK